MQHRTRSLVIISVVTAAMLQLRLSLTTNAVDFSTADNPTAKSPAFLTRLLTFLYLPAYNFQLLLYPGTMSFDWGMDAIPRLTTFDDPRNLVSLLFYACLATVVAVTVQRLRRRMHLVQASAGKDNRKPRTIKKRKAFQLPVNCNNSANITCNMVHSLTNAGSNHHSFSVGLSNIASVADKINSNNNNNECYKNNNYSAKLSQTTDCLCATCKQGSTERHSSACRALNNNNIPLMQCDCSFFRHSPSPPRKRRHHQNPMHSSFVAAASTVHLSNAPTSQSADSHNAIHRSTTTKHSPIKSPAITPTTAKARNIASAIDSSYTPHSLPLALSMSADPTINHAHFSHPSTASAAVVVLSIALLTLPFLPATNLFFYVGFVVAERILYLPSVGYCLLVGLGAGKLMDSGRAPRKISRTQCMYAACAVLLVAAYSLRTIDRNADWYDEESLYRSAISINPPKGKYCINRWRFSDSFIVLVCVVCLSLIVVVCIE